MRKLILLAIAFALGIWVYLLLLAATRSGLATRPTLGPEDGIQVYFSPNGGCTAAITDEIAKAKKTVDVQAYAFTSQAIAQALADASGRGVAVRIILDKSEKSDRYSEANFFLANHITVYIDDQHAISHNKVAIIDGNVLVTGSFNFTKASEDKNAENVLILHDRPKLLASYHANFEHHLGHSVPLTASPN